MRNISLQEQEVRIKTYISDYDSDDTDNHHDRASGWEGCEAWRRDVDDGDDHDNVTYDGRESDGSVIIMMMVMTTNPDNEFNRASGCEWVAERLLLLLGEGLVLLRQRWAAIVGRSSDDGSWIHFNWFTQNKLEKKTV